MYMYTNIHIQFAVSTVHDVYANKYNKMTVDQQQVKVYTNDCCTVWILLN
jgi:hypothetical protein